MDDHSSSHAVELDPPRSHDALEEYAPLPYQSLDPNGNILTVNEAWCESLGYDREAVLGEWFGGFLGPDSRERFGDRFSTYKSNGTVSSVQFDMIREDGDEIPVSLFGNIEYDDDGDVRRTHCQFREISTRRGRDLKLRPSQKAFEHLFHGVNDAVVVHDLSGSILLANETAVERLGYSEAELLEMTPEDLDAPEFVSKIDGRMDDLRQSGKSTFETVHVTKSGDRIPTEISSSLIEYHGERVVLSVARDISERKKRERDLELFRTLVDHAGDAIFVIDESTGEFLDVNQTACEMLQYDRADLVGRTVPGISDAFDSVGEYLAHLSDTENDRSTSLIHEQRRADGTAISIEVTARSMTIEGERYRVSVVRDISERIERERELERMKQAVDASAHAIYVTDTDGTIEYVNPAFETITGYSRTEAVGENPRILNSGEMDDAYFETLWQTLLDGDIWEEVVINRRKSGDLYHAHQTIAHIEDGEDTVVGYVAIQTDITDRKRREEKVAKRERILRALHSTNQQFLSAEDRSAVFDGVVKALTNAHDLSHYAILRFDDESGDLEPAAISPKLIDQYGDITPQPAGETPIWEAFADGDSRLLTGRDTVALGEAWATSAVELLVVPIKNHGVILIIMSADETIETVDVELIEVLAANAKAILSRMEAESHLAELSRELSIQEEQMGELESLIEAIESVQQRLAESDTKESLQRALCEELIATDPVDFAWVGTPETSDTHLSASAWAGGNRGFLDAVSLESEHSQLPSQRAAEQRKPVSIDRISKRATVDSWATDALSRRFRSVLSVPLLHDDVLYGVVTMYSTEESAFARRYLGLITELGNLVANYLSILNIRHADASTNFLEVEFRVTDSSCPLYVLAGAADRTLEFETVLERLEDTVRVLITVRDGDARAVHDAATTIPSVTDAEFFGAPQDRQVTLTLRKPFLGSAVVEHGGRLLGAIARPDEARVRISLPQGISVRPLAESLNNLYPESELVARRQTTGQAEGTVGQVSEYLTDRQFEILKAAYYGGYYDSPRGITGENLADNFEISNTVVHDHLKAGHRRILSHVFDSASDNEGLNN